MFHHPNICTFVFADSVNIFGNFTRNHSIINKASASDSTLQQSALSEKQKAITALENLEAKMLKAEKVPDDLSFSSISIVGRYALNFHFSDGHDTGIYSFDFLRKLSV